MIFMIIVINLLPITGFVLAVLYKFKAKGKISKISGFRTDMSMRSNETWKFAHNYLAKVMLLYGICFLMLNSVILCLNLICINIMTVVVIVQLLTYCFIGYGVNCVLKKRFGNN